MKKILALLLLGVLVFDAVADQITIAGSTKDGSFIGYEGGKFEFRTDKGRLIKQSAVGVSKLTITEQRKAQILRTDGKSEVAKLSNFEKNTFHFDKEGTALTIPLAQIKSIEYVLEFDQAGGGMVDAGPNKYPIPVFNLAELLQGQVTPQQQAVANRFTKAKKEFDDFVAANTALLQQADQQKGPKRSEILTQLRQRKTAEEPLRRALGAVYQELVTAFPGRLNSK